MVRPALLSPVVKVEVVAVGVAMGLLPQMAGLEDSQAEAALAGAAESTGRGIRPEETGERAGMGNA
jgi:hypothetical protein